MMTRREMLAGAAALGCAPLLQAQTPKLKIAIFSKHLQFLQGAALAELAAITVLNDRPTPSLFLG